jgi:Domain of unknown function (DUF4166)/Saccharopine dehydrogenase NADP binding domain
MNPIPARVLILGGYGTFGGRLAELLASDARVTLLIAGRSLSQAQAFCDRLAPGASRSAVRFDRDGDVLVQIRVVNPDLVVDATGPFQCYGEDPYRVIKACLAHAIDYLDLADGSDFVKGVAQFDREARERGVFILSGVSSFPVLTAAVLRRLAHGLATLDTITGGIAPSPYAGVGVNVIRAIASYSGKRLALVRGGRPSFGIAMTESLRYTISPPGRLPLRNIRFSLVDVPDLQVLPQMWPGLQSLWMGAGPVPEILHRMLNGLAWLVRLRLLPSLLPFSFLIHQVSNRVRWGEHRGGMFVAISGTDARGVPATRSWHLLAEGDDGPLIPSMACQAIIERCLAARRPVAGARAATADLELEDYEALFARRTIFTGTRTSDPAAAPQPLYQRILGDAWQALPAPLRAMHQCASRQVAAGEADVVRGQSPLARLAAFVIGFPAAGQRVPVQVEFAPGAGGERWTRTFAGRSFTSFQSEGRGASAHLLRERFGALTFDLALVVEAAKLCLVVRRWSLWGLPLPLVLAPAGDSYETVIDDRFHFHVEIRHRLIGLIVGYRGWLEILPRPICLS